MTEQRKIAAPPIVECIPAELMDKTQWVCWSFEWRKAQSSRRDTALNKWKTMGEYVLAQQHRHDAVGELARKLAQMGNANIAKMQRDQLSQFVSDTLGLTGWNIIDDLHYDEWMSKAGYDARSGYVYVIKQSGDYKIGVTKDIRKRLSTIQMSTPKPVQLVHSFYIGGIYADAYEWEKALHQRFSKRKIRGEWFRLTNTDVKWLRQLNDEFMYYMGLDCTMPVPSDIDAALKEAKAVLKKEKENRTAPYSEYPF